MATNTLPTFRAHSPASPLEPQFVVSYPYEGATYVVGFDSFNDLLNKLTSYKDADDNYLEGEIINRIVDFSEESMEWSEPTYPLFQPPADSVTSRTAFSGPLPQECSVNAGFITDVEPSPFWEWAAACLRVGAVTAPWVLLLLLGRFAWGKWGAW